MPNDNTSTTAAAETSKPTPRKRSKKPELDPIFISQEQGWTAAGLGKTCFYELKKLGWFKTYSNPDSTVPGSTRVALLKEEFFVDCTRYWNGQTPRHTQQAVGDA